MTLVFSSLTTVSFVSILLFGSTLTTVSIAFTALTKTYL